MLDLLNPIIYLLTAVLLISVIFYAVGRRSVIIATLAQRQQLQDQCSILTFLLPKNKSKLQLKIGQQILIKTKPNTKGKQFTPIQITNGSFKILVIPTLNLVDKEQNILIEQLSQLNKGQSIFVNVVKNNLQYVGNCEIKIKNTGNKSAFSKKFKSIYVLAQGSKIPAAYQIIKGICQQKNSKEKPGVTVLFVGGGIGDFALKNQFQHLEENSDNIKYYYSLPVKGERQPSLDGMGISSDKISQTFQTSSQQTFCILCAEQSDICVTVERSLLSKGVPTQHIYKY